MSLLLTVAIITAIQSDATEPRLMRLPSIHGDTVVFTYAGDLWVTKTEGGIARRLTTAPGLETRPFISADGQTVAFTGQYEGPLNIYTIPIEGGQPKRLTYDPDGDNCLGWTPDGKIAYGSVAGSFTSRQSALWTVDPKGGLPQKTKLSEVASVSYFPDGKTVAYNRAPSFGFNWRHYRGGTQGKISFYNFPENRYWELPTKREQSYFPLVVGQAVYYISDRGTGVQNLWKYDLDSKRDVQLTHYNDADIKTPSTDGKSIVFERDGLLYLYDIASGNARKIDTRILSEDLNARPYLRSLGSWISDVTLSPSGARVAVEARGNIFSVPVKQGDTRNFTGLTGVRARFPRWSPDGKTIAYITDETGNYEIYTQPQLGGTPTQLTTTTPGTIESLEWSPNGKYISFTKSDFTLSILDVSTKKVTQVVKALRGLGSYDWSPDNRWITYTMTEPNHFQALYLYEVDTAKSTQIDNGYFNDGQPSFDLNGKYLYFVSTRSFHPSFGDYEFSLKVEESDRIYVIPLAKATPNPLTVQSDEEPESGPGSPSPKPSRPGGPPAGGPGGAPPSGSPPAPPMAVDIDGIASRILPLPMQPGSYGGVIGLTNGFLYFSNGTIFKFDFESRQSAPILSGVFGALATNPSRSKLAMLGIGGLSVIDVHPGNPPGAGHVETGQVEAVINPRDEWHQMFWEAWRHERDHYYDPTFHGLDWNAIGHHYEHYLQWVNSRIDLSYVIGLMIGELGTSHSYVIGGDLGITARPIPIGLLGADYEVANGRLRFAKIYRGHNFEENARGPLAEPGTQIHEGDYLLEIDGHGVDANTNPASLLADKVERYVTITVNSTPNLTGAQKFRVRPVGSETNLRYVDFVDQNIKKVNELSGGRIGYMHIRDTQAQGSIDFVRGFYSQTDKDAMIVDERWNGGGYIQPWFVDTLARKTKAGVQRRTGLDDADEVAIDGPKAMLINGYAGSGGDFFPWMFRQARLGPLIGERTWGGLVGINSPPNLVDGGVVTAPEFSIYDLDTGEIIAENHGVDPDITVDARPDLVAEGKDPQLEAAVNYLLDQLKKHPPRAPRKQFPKVGADGRIHP